MGRGPGRGRGKRNQPHTPNTCPSTPNSKFGPTNSATSTISQTSCC
jgi:hypothetical protein